MAMYVNSRCFLPTWHLIVLTVMVESTVTVKQTTATGYAADPIELQFDQNLRTTGTGIVTEQVHKTKLYNFLCHEFLIFFCHASYNI